MSNALTMQAMEYLPEMTGIRSSCQLHNNPLLGQLQKIEDLDKLKHLSSTKREKCSTKSTKYNRYW